MRSASINSTTFSRLKTHTRKIDIFPTDSVTPGSAAVSSRRATCAGHRTARAGDAKPRRQSRGARSTASSNGSRVPPVGCARGRHARAFQRRGGFASARVRDGCAFARRGGFAGTRARMARRRFRRRCARASDTISRRTATVASTRASGVSARLAEGTRASIAAPRGCCPMFPKSLPGPSERLDVLSSSRGLGPDTRFLTVSSHAILTYQLRSRSCAPWVWRARRSARATSARSPRGSGARGTTARAHPSPVTARPAVATPRAPSARRTNRSSGRTTTLP